MPAGCDLISTTNVGSAATSIAITGIPQTYKALRIVSILGTDGTAQFDGEVQCTIAGFGSGQYNNVAPAYFAATAGAVSKTAWSGSYSYAGESNTTRTTQFGAGWYVANRNSNNVASMEIFCSNYADTGSPLVLHIKSSTGADNDANKLQLIQSGVSTTTTNGALTAITFNSKSGSINFTTASSVRIYGYSG